MTVCGIHGTAKCSVYHLLHDADTLFPNPLKATLEDSMSTLYDRVIYGIPAAMAAFYASEVHAAEGVGAVAARIQGQIDDVGNLVVGGSFLGGLTLSASGLMRLKQAADSQGTQTRYSEGLWRLGLGSALVAIPAVVKMGAATAGDGFTDAMSAGKGGIQGF